MASEVDSLHPEYEDISDDWALMRDAIDGERTVKGKLETYLPMPQGFTAQLDNGSAMYAGYILRAKFPELLGPTLRGMVGIIHRIAADIELPDVLEPLREACTKDGLALDALHERITYELLSTGRFGLLVDMPDETGTEDLPYIAGYNAETIINWSAEADFFVLDETHLERDGFQWVDTSQFRVLQLGTEEEQTAEQEGGVTGGTYTQTLWIEEGSALAEQEPVEPQMRGGKKFEEIPFVVVGTTDIVVDIDEIPLIGVARCMFNMYRLDADYKHQLYMSGQETLIVISDVEQPVSLVGSGVVLNLPTGSDAKYVGPTGVGIEKHKEAITDEREQAVIAGARIFDVEKKAQESGEALKMRWAAQTASLTSIAINSAKGLEKALRYCAMFVGADPEQVVVRPNLQFVDNSLDPAKAKFLVDMWMAGAISKRTLDEALQKGDIRTYDRTFEEEQDLINEEIPDIQTPQLTIEQQKAEDSHARALEQQQAKPQVKPMLVAKQ